MSGNTLGTLYCVTSFGESHGPAIGCVVDGCPPGLALDAADIQRDLDRRKPGTSRHVTQRRESDTVEILSGVFDGRTTGTPIALLIRNEDPRSKDYAAIAEDVPPGARRLRVLAEVRHPRLPRRRSRVGARDGGARGRRRHRAQVARRALRRRDPRPSRAAGAEDDPVRGLGARRRESVLRRQRDDRRRSSKRSWTRLRKSGDSCGARITVVASGVPVGWGEPVYGRLDADLRAGDDEHQRGEGRRDRRRLRERRAARHRALRRDDAAGLPVEQRRRRSRRHLDRARTSSSRSAVKPTSSIRLDRRSIDKAGNAVIVNTHRPARSLRRHPRDADRRGDARDRADGPCVAPPRAERRRGHGDAEDRRAGRRRRCDAAPRAPVDDPDPDEA